MELKEILRLMAEKYPENDRQRDMALLIYDDESGRLTFHSEAPYDYKATFYFHTIDQLIQHLQEK